MNFDYSSCTASCKRYKQDSFMASLLVLIVRKFVGQD